MSRPHTTSRLTRPHGNNAFAYESRKRTDPDPKLRLPELKTITAIDDIELGTLPVFAELDDQGNVIMYTGLKHIYHIPFCTDAFSCVPSSIDVKNMDVKNYVPTVPIYIFDNHNYALYFWAMEWANNAHPYRVIHIDQHSDLGTPPEGLPKTGEYYSPLQDTVIAHYTTHTCNVGNFIRPALDAGIISDCLRIKNEYDLERLCYPQDSSLQTPYILDIDLDFWAPEMGTNITTSIPLVQSLMREASLITIASSPYFLDQAYALELLRKLFNK